MRTKSWYIMTVLAMLVAGYAIVQYVVIGVWNAGFVMQKLEEAMLSRFWDAVLYVHIAGSVAALVLGPFNLLTSIRNRYPNRHRIMGRIYVVGVGLGGLSGIYLAFEATGGMVATLGFLGLAICWLYTAARAVQTIRSRRIAEHRRWMIRNYALTLAAVTLRLWLGLFVALWGDENFTTSYTIIAWLCWVPNLLIAEWLLFRIIYGIDNDFQLK
ncbi:DUF2306 domain-containing protein [Paenibacillus sp. strain BS8-2]